MENIFHGDSGVLEARSKLSDHLLVAVSLHPPDGEAEMNVQGSTLGSLKLSQACTLVEGQGSSGKTQKGNVHPEAAFFTRSQ